MTPSDRPEDDPWDAEWEPGDESLRRFAAQFDAARPELPADALERVRQCLTAEVVRRQRRRRMRLAILCGSLAASLLVVIGGLFYAMQGRQPAGRQPILAQSPALSTEVQDRYRVAMEWPAAVDVPAAPLVPLDEYRTLIGEIH